MTFSDPTGSEEELLHMNLSQMNSIANAKTNQFKGHKHTDAERAKLRATWDKKRRDKLSNESKQKAVGDDNI